MAEFNFFVGYMAFIVCYVFLIGIISPALAEDYDISVPEFPTFEGNILDNILDVADYIISTVNTILQIITTVPSITYITALLFTPLLLIVAWSLVTHVFPRLIHGG